MNPAPVNSQIMLGLGVLGILVNGFAFYRLRLFSKGTGENLISLHLLEDLWGWIIVFIGAIAIYFLSWYWLDPLLSIFLAVFILWRSFGQMTQIGRIFLLGASHNFSLDAVSEVFTKVKGVKSFHHVHVWELDTDFNVVSAHIVLHSDAEASVVKKQIRDLLLQLGHCEVTLEFESSDELCLDPAHPT